MMDQYFSNDLLEPFESIFIGSTGLTMAFIWLRRPCECGGTSTVFLYIAYNGLRVRAQFIYIGYEYTFPHDVISVVGDYPNDIHYDTTRLVIAFIWLR